MLVDLIQAKALAAAHGPEKIRSALDVAATWEDGLRVCRADLHPHTCTGNQLLQCATCRCWHRGLSCRPRLLQVQLVMDAALASHCSEKLWVDVEAV